MDIKDFVAELKQEIVIQNRVAEMLNQYGSEHIKGYKIGIKNTLKAVNEIIEKFENANRSKTEMKASKIVVLVMRNY